MPMTRQSTSSALTIPAILVVAATVATGVWWTSLTAALDRVQERAQAKLALSSDRLTSELQGYRDLAVQVSDHPDLLALVLDRRGDPVAVGAQLQRMADRTGAQGLYVVDQNGALLAASGGSIPIGAEPAIERAMNGALGRVRQVTEGARPFIFAAPIFAPQGPAKGALLVTRNVNAIEWNWPASPSAVFFTDPNGLIFVTNLSELILARHRGAAFPDLAETTIDGHVLWSLSGGPYLPERALHLTLDLPIIGMTAQILEDVRPAQRIALYQGATAGLLALAVGIILYLATQRRRTLAAQNAVLEARVAARTAELSDAN